MQSRREPGCGRALFTCVAAAIVLAGCKSPVGRDDVGPETRPEQSQEFAEPAAPLTTDQSGAPVVATSAPTSPAPSPTTATSGGGSSSAGGRSDGGDGSTETTATRPYRSVLTASDAAGDAGLEAPAYADIRGVTIETNDTDARVTIEVSGTLPERLPADEVMGFGLDLFRTGSAESDYQLFAEGVADGWFAHLQTPDGFVRYPGTFALGGTKLLFEVPWSALGGPPPVRISSFVDWSRKRLALNASADDALPDRGRLDVAG